MNPDNLRKDPAFAAMTLDILHNVLSRADNPGRLVDYLTEEIRELTGARCVLFIQCLGEVHRVLGVNPTRHLAWAESPLRESLYHITHNLSAAEVWDPATPSDASQLLQQDGFALSMAVPLHVGAVRVGAMLVLGLPDQQHIASEIKLLTTLATIVALVLRNSFLFENQVAIIAEGTKELALAAFQRKKADEALYESQECLEFVLKGSQLGFWDWNLETNVVKRNERWAEMLGYKLDEIDFTVKHWLDLIHPDDRSMAKQSIEDHLEGRTPMHKIEYRMLTKDGQFRWIFDQAQIVKRDANGRPLRMSGTHTDITEHKRAEQEKANLQSQLQQAQKMEAIGQLAGGVAHDFNNMLSAILGHAELGMDQIDPSQPLFANLQEIGKAAMRSADITRQLLAFARKQTVAPKVLDLNETVEGMLKMLRRLIGEDIDFAWLPGFGLWPVKMDPSQLDQILANLCVNARDAIAGVGKIIVETENNAFDEEYCNTHAGFVVGEYVRLSVSDNGCGINKETLAHIFEPFFTTKGTGKGTGLGLATVYGAVKQNNGFVNVYSEPRKGTTFTLYLPKHRDPVGAAAATEVVEPAVGGHETILLVEDEPTILNMTRTMLERLGYTVLSAATPHEAFRLVSAHSGEIHLLLTDVVMPEMNGRDLAQTLLPINPQMKCLFMSGYTSDIIAQQGILDEGIQFLQKPFSKKDLASKVRMVLDNS
jgi:PAS domain S-box-containing protein